MVAGDVRPSRALPKWWGWRGLGDVMREPEPVKPPIGEPVEVELMREDLENEVRRLSQLVTATRAELRATREALEDERARHLSSRIALIQAGFYDA